MTDSPFSQETRRLYLAVVETVHEAIEYVGSTRADESYVHPHARPVSSRSTTRCTHAIDNRVDGVDVTR